MLGTLGPASNWTRACAAISAAVKWVSRFWASRVIVRSDRTACGSAGLVLHPQEPPEGAPRGRQPAARVELANGDLRRHGGEQVGRRGRVAPPHRLEAGDRGR